MTKTAIDVRREEVVYFSEAHAKIPGEPMYSTVYSWHTVGRKTLRKKIVKLEAVKLPKGLATTMEAWSRFVSQLND